MSERIKLTEKDLDVVETVDGNAFLETPIQYTIQECKDLKAQILSDLKLQELVKEKIENIKKHLENIERQQMTGKNLGDVELTSGDYVFMANTKLILESELKEWQSLIEESEK